MSQYFVMSNSDSKVPGSGDVEQTFRSDSDGEAMDMAKRHFEGSGFCVWASDGNDHRGHIKMRHVGPVDPPKGREP